MDLIREKIDEIPNPITKGTWGQICDEKDKMNMNLQALKNSDIQLMREASKKTKLN